MSHMRELHVKLMHVQLLKNTSRDFMVVFVHVSKLKSTLCDWFSDTRYIILFVSNCLSNIIN